VSYNFVTIAGIEKMEFLSFCYRYLKTQDATTDKKIRIKAELIQLSFCLLILAFFCFPILLRGSKLKLSRCRINMGRSVYILIYKLIY